MIITDEQALTAVIKDKTDYYLKLHESCDGGDTGAIAEINTCMDMSDKARKALEASGLADRLWEAFLDFGENREAFGLAIGHAFFRGMETEIQTRQSVRYLN